MVTFPEGAILQTFQVKAETFLMLGLDLGDGLEVFGDVVKTLLAGNFGCLGIEIHTLVLLFFGGSGQILGRRTDNAGVYIHGHFNLATLKEFEIHLGVVHLVVGCYGENLLYREEFLLVCLLGIKNIARICR